MFVTAQLSRITSTGFVSAVSRWPVESQQQARRNAMIASTALAQRRAELNEVEDYLASLVERSAPEVAAQAANR